MSDGVKKLTIEGFRSIRRLDDFELRSLNVLVGANGCGKSNFVRFFRFVKELVDQRLQISLQTMEGGANGCLYMGPKVTNRLDGKFQFGPHHYEFALVPTLDNRLVFESETCTTSEEEFPSSGENFGSGHAESGLKSLVTDSGVVGSRWNSQNEIYETISGWVSYHFHDTSLLSAVRRPGSLHENEILGPDAANLAAFLARMQRSNREHYQRIRDVVRLAAPFFEDFLLRPSRDSSALIELQWRQKDSDRIFRAHQLSDGTLRFICLATALLQPLPPATTIIDEPELGLHPYALTLLGDLIKGASRSRQLIIATQSAALLSQFEPEDVIVVERYGGESTFARLDSRKLSVWIEEYTLGELWEKNVIGGRPQSESAPNVAFHGEAEP